MNNETLLFTDSYLAHHGVKGMKWGVRRYQNSNGSLTPAGIKRYAKKGYAEDSYNSNKTRLGKAYDKITGSHKISGNMRYDMSSDKERKARAEKYVADKKRADGNNTDYTDKQRKRDQALYGNRAEKRINKKLNEGHGLQGARHYEVERKERSEKAKRVAKRGAKKTAKFLANVGMAYVSDKVFNDGRGAKLAKESIIFTGRAVVSAYVKATGGYNIRWYD